MGPWGIATLIAVAALATETGRAGMRKAFRTGIRAGYQAKESAAELAEKAKGYKDEVIAEIRAEDEGESAHEHKTKKRSKAASH